MLLFLKNEVSTRKGWEISQNEMVMRVFVVYTCVFNKNECVNSMCKRALNFKKHKLEFSKIKLLTATTKY